MKIIEISSRGFTDIADITDRVQEIIDEEKFKEGVCNLFVIGSTAALTTSEGDENLYEDIREVLESIAPYKKNWKHHLTWHDDNGAAHIRATLIGPGLTVPIMGGKLMLGTWQKIILIDFDTAARTRKIVVNLSGGK